MEASGLRGKGCGGGAVEVSLLWRLEASVLDGQGALEGLLVRGHLWDQLGLLLLLLLLRVLSLQTLLVHVVQALARRGLKGRGLRDAGELGLQGRRAELVLLREVLGRREGARWRWEEARGVDG